MSDRRMLRQRKTVGSKELFTNQIRAIITFSLILICFYLIFPTIQWYMLIDKNQKDLTLLSPLDMKEKGYTQEQIDKVKQLKTIKRKSINLGLDLQGGLYLVIKPNLESLPPDQNNQTISEMIDKAMIIISNRIDQFGVGETYIRKLNTNAIEIEIPGAKDVDRIIDIITRTGSLTFQLVDEKTEALLYDTEGAIDLKTGQILKPELIPEDSSALWQYDKDQYGNLIPTRLRVVKKKIELDGKTLTSVATQQNQQTAGLEIAFQLDTVGATRFAKVTAENIGKQLAIVLDNKVQSSPVINSAITTGQASISGKFTPEEAKDLELILKAGSLPVPLVIVEQNEVGPTLGRDSIKKGIFAGLIGAGIVAVIMVSLYWFSGLVAYLLVILSIYFLISFLAALGLTLTLPGIAGIILNIGMGVDAFVIIFEKIREEYKKQSSKQELMNILNDSLYISSATIVDSNLTTLFATFALIRLGTGAIKGFGVTLSIGIIANMIIVLITGRWILTAMYQKWSVSKLKSMGGVIR